MHSTQIYIHNHCNRRCALACLYLLFNRIHSTKYIDVYFHKEVFLYFIVLSSILGSIVCFWKGGMMRAGKREERDGFSHMILHTGHTFVFLRCTLVNLLKSRLCLYKVIT